MQIPFIIYIRAVGIYAMLTIPAMISPIIYVISLFYAFIYGWFAWALFTILYYLIMKICKTIYTRMLFLTLSVPMAVAFAFQMIEVLKAEENVWLSDGFLLFPLGATIGGWISLFISAKKIEAYGMIETGMAENAEI